MICRQLPLISLEERGREERSYKTIHISKPDEGSQVSLDSPSTLYEMPDTQLFVMTFILFSHFVIKW
jgi:hypothetical protein